ncbi:MAG TPA: TIM barrel protein, partial [Rhodoblastus sp.]|nr:TIM barrel protein [Rhodoblastus sp.]
KRLHMMAGLASSHDPKALVTYQGALELAARKLGEAGLDLVIEPINGRNMPGYFLNDFGLAEKIISASGMANVKLQFDIYHRQIMHGDVTMALRAMMPITGHVQIASVPSRNEPDGEELNYPFLFAELDRLGYDGYVGCEYNPRGPTTDGLAWFKSFARS